jgi:RHS repeat-associated protein
VRAARRFIRWIAAALVLMSGLAAGPAAATVLSPSPSAVSAGTLGLPDKPGSVKGLTDPATVKVFSAQISYSIPITLPQGRAAFGPALALTYSGELGNGPLGVGWTMGTIAIRRTMREGVPSYTDADQLELVGVGSGGNLYTNDGKRFWVEGAGHSVKVDRYGNWFDVTDSNGVRYVLGLDPNSVDGNGDRTFAWLVESIIDVSGKQRIDFTYEHTAGEVYLKSITWGPPIAAGGAPAFSLQVELENRPDPVISWAKGYEVRTTKRVSALQVTSFGETLRRYSLSYLAPGTSFRLSRLSKVSLTGREKAGVPLVALPPVGLKYEPPTGEGATELSGLEGWMLNERGTNLLDVDGDGMADLYRMEQGRHFYRKGTGKGFSEAQYRVTGAEGTDLESAKLMDLDGDSRPDLVRIVNDTWRWSHLVPESPGSLKFRWVTQGDWPGTSGVPLAAANTVFADVNGDRRTDVVQGAAGAILVRLGTGNGLGPVIRRSQVSPIDADVEPGNPNVHFEDMNGDHLVDVVQFTDEWMKVWLGRGDGTFVAWSTFEYPWGRGAFSDKEVLLADLDRDGVLDLIHITAGHVHWFPGLPGGGFAKEMRGTTRPVGAAYDAVVTVADVNGNGSQDVIWSTSTGMWVLDLAGHSAAGMIHEIDNGMGMTSTFKYSTSALLSVAAEEAGQPWQQKLPASIPVPVGVDTAFASGDPTRSVQYETRDGVWDGAERQFAGFLGSVRIVPGATSAETLREETRFLPGFGVDRVLRGVAWLSRTRNGDGVLFTETLTDWVSLPVTASPALPDSSWARKSAKRAETTRSFEGVTTPLETISSFEYDDEIRLEREHHLGRTDLQGDEREVKHRYADDDGTWVRDRSCEETVMEGDGTIASQTQTLYDDDKAVVLPLCRAGRGWPRVTKGLRKAGFEPGETDEWLDLSRRTYDAFGNPTKIYEDGVERDLVYDTRSLRPTSESVVPVVGQTPLSWNMTWDDVLGVPSSGTDANGVTTVLSYDGLGRQLSAEVSPSSCPHTYFAYDWTKPDGAGFFRPTTTSYVFDGDHGTLSFTGSRATACDAKDPRGKPFGNVPNWRQSIDADNGAGEDAFAATRLGAARWIIGGWTERDGRGNTTLAADSFYFDGAALPTTRPSVPDFRFRTLHHDVLGRPDLEILPNNSTKNISYAAYTQTVTFNTVTPGEVRRAPVVTRMDGQGRVVHTERTVTGLVERGDAKYDADGRIVEISLQGGEAIHTYRYDTLGDLRVTKDPDTGERRLRYDTRQFLIRQKNGAGQVVGFFYDQAGRLIARGPRTDFASPLVEFGGRQANDYVYHYDAQEPGQADLGKLKTRLAWVEEPSGPVAGSTWKAAFGYDLFGRQTTVSRTIANVSALETMTFSPSGLSLGQSSPDDGFSLVATYDPAGRLIKLGDVWRAGNAADVNGINAFDAAGRVLDETYGNGLQQSYVRDSLGLPKTVSLTKPMGTQPGPMLYGVDIETRTGYGAPMRVKDLQPTGRDQGATYLYDEAQRLTDATLGDAAATQWRFRFRYDGLQNMIGRFQQAPPGTAPASIKVISGYYRYGGTGFGPRQLASITHKDCPGEFSTFQYDGAGRLTRENDKALTYNSFDQLTDVQQPVGTTLATHGYGFDGSRAYTSSGGTVQRWFSSGYTLVQGGATNERWHYVSLGARTVARLIFPGPGSTMASAEGLTNRSFARVVAQMPRIAFFGALLGGAFLAFVGLRGRRPIRGAIASALACLLVVAPMGCQDAGSSPASLEQLSNRVYFHSGFAAGPAVLTSQSADITDERRSEPFGQVLDGDLTKGPINSLNKETNLATGWSYHGARWMAPQTGRWLTPDPAVKTPSATLVSEPWDLHPYQYVRQNPAVFWDPDGAILNVLAGALIGAAIGVASRAIVNVVNGAPVTEGLKGAFVGGVVAGALAGMTAGASLAVTAVGGGVASVMGGGASRYVETGNAQWTTQNVVNDFAIGSIGTVVLSKVASAVVARSANVRPPPAKAQGTYLDPNYKLRTADGRFAPTGAPKVKPSSSGKVHGNTAGDQPATLYEKYDRFGTFRKHGISQDPQQRYTKTELDGGYVVETQTLPRRDALRVERSLVETNPGPDNHEPWAGSKKQE